MLKRIGFIALACFMFSSLAFAAVETPGYRLSSSKVEEDAQSWYAGSYRYSIGYENAVATSGPLGSSTFLYDTGTGAGTFSTIQNSRSAVVLGVWNGSFGIDLLFGISMSKRSVTSKVQDTDNNPSSATAGRVIVTSIGGSGDYPASISLGVRPKFKIYRNNWLLIYSGGVAGMTWTGSSTYDAPGGTSTRTYTDKSQNTYTDVNANYGTDTVSTSMQFFGGPMIGSEFYLKWIPHLALGFSTGFFFTTGGTSKAVRTVSNQTTVTTNGVAASPSGTTVSQTTDANSGVSANTYGAGGSLFNLLNTSFTVRYVW